MKIHGHNKSNKDRTLTYNSWRAMKERCLYYKHISYSNYGGKGVEIDPRWLRFENFLKDMGNRPSGRSLDRIDPNGNYNKSNCRWATSKVQNSNKRIKKQGV